MSKFTAIAMQAAGMEALAHVQAVADIPQQAIDHAVQIITSAADRLNAGPDEDAASIRHLDAARKRKMEADASELERFIKQFSFGASQHRHLATLERLRAAAAVSLAGLA